MSRYTMQLRAIIEHYTQDQEGLSWNERIEEGRKHLFDFYYPFFDEDYKKTFETNIIRHFYMREIGFETEGLFKMRLENWLNINMPYFNKLFESEKIEYDPLINASMLVGRDRVNKKDRTDDRTTQQTSEIEGQASGQSDQNVTVNSETNDDHFNRHLKSDTPDSRLQISSNDGSGIIEYASSIEEDKNKNKTTNTGSSETTQTTQDQSSMESQSSGTDQFTSNIDENEHFLERREGKIGSVSQSKMMMEYRQSLMRIEQMIHKELNQLFMLVY